MTGTLRAGPPVRLAVGEPSGLCESEQWIDLVPVTATEYTPGSGPGNGRPGAHVDVGTTTTAAGHAFYARSDGPNAPPLGVETTLRQIDALSSLEAYERRVEPALKRARLGGWLLVSGMALTVVGVVALSSEWIGEPPSWPALPVGLSALVLGSITSVAGLFTTPNRVEGNQFGLRARILANDEFSPEAIRAALERYHWGVRTTCARLSGITPGSPTTR